MVVLLSLISVTLVSLISLLGAVFLLLNRRHFEKIIFATLSLSTGVLLAASFFDLYPEALKTLPNLAPTLLVVGIVFFFILEKIIHWHHCLGKDCVEKPLAYVSLIGDGVHNFVDGMAIAAAFLVSPFLGLATTLAVVAHEIPHELSDFSLLIYSGFSNRKALFYNFLSALTAVAGTIFVLLISQTKINLVPYLLPLTAGNFIYIATSDLLPELKQKTSLKSTLFQSLLIAAGLLVVLLMKQIIPES